MPNNVIQKVYNGWNEYLVAGGSSGEEHEFITQEEYEQLTPAQQAEKVYMITGEGETPTPGGETAIESGDVVITNLFRYSSSDTQWYIVWANGSNNTQVRVRNESWVEKLSQNLYNNDDIFLIQDWYAYYSYGNLFHKKNLSTWVDETVTVYTGSYTVYHKWSDWYMYFLNNSVNPKVVKKVSAADLTIEDSTEVEYNSIPSGLYYKGLYYSQDNDDYVAVDATGTEVKRYSEVWTINGIYNDKLYKTVGDVAYAIATI